MRCGGPRFVLESPGSSHGALIRPAGPWFVLRGPGTYCGLWSVLRGPDSCAGPDPSRGARVRYVEPWCFPQGPDPSHGALKPDRKSTSSRGPSGSRGPDYGFGAKYMLAPVIDHGGMARMPPPPDRHWLRGYCPLCPAVPAPLAPTTDLSKIVVNERSNALALNVLWTKISTGGSVKNSWPDVFVGQSVSQSVCVSKHFRE